MPGRAAEFASMHTEGRSRRSGSAQDTVVFPGFDGGAEWGGSAYDPASGRLFVNANDLAWTGALAPDDGGADGRGVYLNVVRDLPPRRPPRHAAADSGAHQPHAVGRAALTTVIRQGVGRMPGFPNLSPDACARSSRIS